MILGQTDPHIRRLKASFDASEIEKSKVAEKIRKGPNGKDFGTSVGVLGQGIVANNVYGGGYSRSGTRVSLTRGEED